jgi:hypothetical protein
MRIVLQAPRLGDTIVSHIRADIRIHRRRLSSSHRQSLV